MTTIKELKELLNNYNDDEQVICQFYTREQLSAVNDGQEVDDDMMESLQDVLADPYVVNFW